MSRLSGSHRDERRLPSGLLEGAVPPARRGFTAPANALARPCTEEGLPANETSPWLQFRDVIRSRLRAARSHRAAVHLERVSAPGSRIEFIRLRTHAFYF